MCRTQLTSPTVTMIVPEIIFMHHMLLTTFAEKFNCFCFFLSYATYNVQLEPIVLLQKLRK